MHLSKCMSHPLAYILPARSVIVESLTIHKWLTVSHVHHFTSVVSHWCDSCVRHFIAIVHQVIDTVYRCVSLLWLYGESFYTNCQSMKWLWCASIYMNCMTHINDWPCRGYRWCVIQLKNCALMKERWQGALNGCGKNNVLYVHGLSGLTQYFTGTCSVLNPPIGYH